MAVTINCTDKGGGGSRTRTSECRSHQCWVGNINDWLAPPLKVASMSRRGYDNVAPSCAHGGVVIVGPSGINPGVREAPASAIDATIPECRGCLRIDAVCQQNVTKCITSTSPDSDVGAQTWHHGQPAHAGDPGFSYFHCFFVSARSSRQFVFLPWASPNQAVGQVAVCLCVSIAQIWPISSARIAAATSVTRVMSRSTQN
jgi:hypothetical protein